MAVAQQGPTCMRSTCFKREGRAATWKEKLAARMRPGYTSRGTDLQCMVYGQMDRTSTEAIVAAAPDASDDDLFVPRRVSEAERPASDVAAMNAVDTSRLPEEDADLSIWESDAAKEELRHRFVTGDWAQGKARDAAAPPEDADDSDDCVFGDFEDVEAGPDCNVDGDAATAAALTAIRDESQARQEEKAAKKAAFNSEYDVGGSAAIRDQPGQGADLEDAAEETYYDALKKEMAGRAARSKAALDSLDPEQRIAMEGYRAGTYVRLQFAGLPCELVQHFTPTQPLLVGGLSSAEEGRGYLQIRLKRHRWFSKTLKTRDPLTFSIGWRRFQSVPIYAIEDQNGRHRMLKYTPEHMHCLANVYGALAPTGAGVAAVQAGAASQKGWRVSATGVVVGLDAAPTVVKKLKLSGTPFKILKNTAFISGMFNSALEVAKFEGAAVRTVSGLRGIIKKASHPGKQDMNAGSFRATFEDKPLMSDIVFLRAWIAVDLPRFYHPETNLLSPASRTLSTEPETQERLLSTNEREAAPKFEGAHISTSGHVRAGHTEESAPDGELQPQQALKGKAACALPGPGAWVGMKTVAQLRREKGIGAPRVIDSLYRTIERAPRKFNPLRIPKALQAELPYASKPKNMVKRKRPTLEQRRAVPLELHEKRAVTLVQQLNALRNAKEAKRTVHNDRRRKELAKKVAETEAWRQKYNKEERKKRAVATGLAEKSKNKRQRVSQLK